MVKKSIFYFVCILLMLAGVATARYFKHDFVTTDGTQHQWREYQGQYVVVNYFAQWCAPCLKEIPELNQFYQENNLDSHLSGEEKVALFSISYDPLGAEEISALAEKHHIQFPVIQEALTDLPVPKPSQLPATYILGPNGKVLRTLMGEQTATGLAAAIAQLKGS